MITIFGLVEKDFKFVYLLNVIFVSFCSTSISMTSKPSKSEKCENCKTFSVVLEDSQLMWRSGWPTSSIISLSNPREKRDFSSIQITWQASQITRNNGAVMPSCTRFAAWYIHLFIEGANLSISLVPVRICVYKRTDLRLFHAIQILSSAQSLCSVACLLTLVP